ncbi:MAG: hypothetical protein ACTHKV_01545, partial [Flavipsychrobacter sp.]
MQFNRRNFIRSASVIAALSLQEMGAMAASRQLNNKGKPIGPDDENYWKNVRQMFPLSKDVAYMNNGTMGPSPYPVIEAVRDG